MIEMIEEHLKAHFQKAIPLASPLREVYAYALFPSGKLFRPKISWALAMDRANVEGVELDFSPESAHALFASFLEFTHCYTLLHDDLPCMDDDSFRRNKMATHLAYGEWQALLAGDGLQGAAYWALSRLDLGILFRLTAWALGPKGTHSRAGPRPFLAFLGERTTTALPLPPPNLRTENGTPDPTLPLGQFPAHHHKEKEKEIGIPL